MNADPQKIPKITDDRQEKAAGEPLYRVLIHNDDVTPMDFVIHILGTFFFVPDPNAAHIMYTAHLNGTAYVQTLPRPEARKRINRALFAARLKGYPLEFSMEPD
jgi:ATP-dependent Clp protease adaptor protein ClpS